MCRACPVTMTKDHSSSQLSVHKALTCSGARVHGPWPIPVWRIARIMQKECVYVFLCRTRATWNEVGLYLVLEMVM